MFTCKRVYKLIVKHGLFLSYLSRKYKIQHLLNIDFHPQLLAIEGLPYFKLNPSLDYITNRDPLRENISFEGKSEEEANLMLKAAFFITSLLRQFQFLRKYFKLPSMWLTSMKRMHSATQWGLITFIGEA